MKMLIHQLHILRTPVRIMTAQVRNQHKEHTVEVPTTITVVLHMDSNHQIRTEVTTVLTLIISKVRIITDTAQQMQGQIIKIKKSLRLKNQRSLLQEVLL